MCRADQDRLAAMTAAERPCCAQPWRHTMNRTTCLFLLPLPAGASPALGQLAGTAQLVSPPAAAGQFTNTVTLHNTGTTTVGTFWFSWIPGEDFLPSLPANITAPPGWVGYIEQGIYDSYSIEWYALS